jgi:hypothetical protein
MPTMESVLMLGVATIVVGGIYLFSTSVVQDTSTQSNTARSAQERLLAAAQR